MFSDAAEKIGDDQNCAETEDCAGGDAPAGFLNGTFHDFPEWKMSLQRPRRPCMAVCLMKIS